MNVEQAYNLWAQQYDTNHNKTRDLEGLALRECLAGSRVERCLEIGCGTGKNTVWLAQISKQVTAVDLSPEMLAKAREKQIPGKVQFVEADITADWLFATGVYDLVTFSLVLEHIEDLNSIFRKLKPVTQKGSRVYVGELHPFKQYSGTKARFDTEEGRQLVPCFDHHISDFVSAGLSNGFRIEEIREYFDEGERATLPRILAIILSQTGD